MNIRTALISVSDKTGVVQLANKLAHTGCKLISTGGTGRALAEANVSFVEVAEHTGQSELMDGRVKTLHPRIHGGILSRRGLDAEEIEREGIEEIDLVVVNLYPFVETISQPKSNLEDAVESIDVGGPAMIRAASKNFHHVLVVVDPKDYDEVLRRINDNQVDLDYRRSMASKAFRHTAAYDAAISKFLERNGAFPESLALAFKRQEELRYGENPHQRAALYVSEPKASGVIPTARQIQGKQLSYNNIADADSALQCVKQLPQPSCVIVKHGNPCGAAIGSDGDDAYAKAFETDPTSAYGGIIALNVPLEETTLKLIVGQQFCEVVVAPVVTPQAAEYAKRRKNLRVLETGAFESGESEKQILQVAGGLLVQDLDQLSSNTTDLRCATKRKPTSDDLRDLMFAWQIAWSVKSNAIVLARNQRTIGIGAGQMSRVDSARIAVMKAQDAALDIEGSVMASDAFFPFRDSIEQAAEHGVAAVIQPGGSIRDDEVVQAADEHNMVMLMTGIRHFRH